MQPQLSPLPRGGRGHTRAGPGLGAGSRCEAGVAAARAVTLHRTAETRPHPNVHTMARGPGAHYQLPGPAGERLMKEVGAREGRPADHCAQTPGPERARAEGRGLHRGHRSSGGPERPSPDASRRCQAGPPGPGGRRSRGTTRGLRAAEGPDSSRERAPCGRRPPARPAAPGSADCLLSVPAPRPPGAPRPGPRRLPVLPARVIILPARLFGSK